MTTKLIDWTKPIQRKDGRPARYLGTLEGPVPRHRHAVAVRGSNGEQVWMYSDDGYPGEDSATISNIPVKHRRWLNMWVRNGIESAFLHRTPEAATHAASAVIHRENYKIIAQLVEWEE